MLTPENCQQATKEWGFNCGPGALCGILGLSPQELRPHLGSFESKGYVNPKLMLATLKSLGVKFKRTQAEVDRQQSIPHVSNALVRIQWGGPWLSPDAPDFDRWRNTHWIGVRQNGYKIFDVNAVHASGGWIDADVWRCSLVPWLCKLVVPEWDGSWYPTHVLEICQCQ